MSVCIVESASSSPTSSKLTQSVPTVKSSYTGKGSDSVTQVGRFIQKYKLLYTVQVEQKNLNLQSGVGIDLCNKK